MSADPLAKLHAVWQQTTTDRTRIASYLESRGLPASVLDDVADDTLRFHPSLEYWDQNDNGDPVLVGHFPAMVAAVTDLAGKGITLHRTYLAPDGPGKLDLGPEHRVKKLMTAVAAGATMGASIKLSPVTSTVGLAEGIETALAVIAATGQHVCAAGSANGLEAVELPPEVTQVHIWADRDESGCGEEAAERAAARFQEEGRTVLIHLPPGPGKKDWLDVYAAQGDEPLLAARAEDPPWQEQSKDKSPTEPVRDKTRGAAPEPRTALPRALLRRFSEMTPESVTWDWQHRLARGKLNMLAGDPGLGKTFVAIYAAALKSRGGTWPDGAPCEAGPVIIMSAEDGATDTLLPRLLAAGADTTPVYLFESVIVTQETESKERLFRLKDDIAILEQAIRETQAELVILDPLNGYLAGVDSHKAAEVRAALAPLALMAERAKATVLIVAHLNKRDGGTPSYRIGGSIDFVAAARTVHGVALESKDSDRRLLLPLKNNLSLMPPGLGFRIIAPGVVSWDTEPVMVDAWSAFGSSTSSREPSKLEAAAEFLAGLPRPRAETGQGDLRGRPRGGYRLGQGHLRRQIPAGHT